MHRPFAAMRYTALGFTVLSAMAMLAVGCTRDADPAVGAPAGAVAAAHGADGAHDTPAARDATAPHDAPGAVDATAPHDAHDVHAAPADPATPAMRWPADEPLARGMRRVRAATDALAHAKHDHLNAAQVKAIAAELKSAVDGMFAECRLAPDADAALHPLLAKVLGASRTLSAGTFDAVALADLQAVLARYVELFEEPAEGVDPP